MRYFAVHCINMFTMENLKIIEIKSVDELTSCAALLAEVYNSPPWNDNWTVAKAKEKLECFFNSPKFYGWMCYDNDQLVGCCVGNIEPYFSGDYYYLKEMFVSVQAQRKGIGTGLMNALKEELEKVSISTIILFTSEEFFPFDFYKKTNFNIMDGMRMMHFSSIEG
jgi:aminoglycoside 6'-N-acetyltransferase I